MRPDDALAVAFAAQLEDGEFHGYALNLSGGTVSDHGAEALANALREKNPVVKLDLGDNRITARLSQFLKTCFFFQAGLPLGSLTLLTRSPLLRQ